jgi:RHS repeat-associated protein
MSIGFYRFYPAVCLALICLLVGSASVLACSPKELGGDGGDITEGNNPMKPDKGDDIDTTTGNMYLDQTDYQGAGVFPLVFTRYYNSQNPAPRSLGRGWTHTYSANVTRDGPDEVRVLRHDGAVFKFLRQASGAWQPESSGINARLERGMEEESPVWYYTTAQDIRETFDAATGRLLRLRNRAGVTQELAYDAEGRIASVTVLGRRLAFVEYGAGGRITKMLDPAGNAFVYTYDSRGRLVKVTYPDGTDREYRYENTEFPNALTAVIDELDVPYLTWEYIRRDSSPQPWATAFEYAAVEDEEARAAPAAPAALISGIGRYEVSYSKGLTAFTDPLGTQRVYDLQSVAGFTQVEATDAPCEDCSGNAKRVAFDAAGNVERETAFRGFVTAYDHEPRNLETARIEAVDTSEERTVAQAWHPAFRLLSQVTEPNRVHGFARDDTTGNLTRYAVTATARAASCTERAWSYTYNDLGQILTSDGPRTDTTDVTTYAYDGQGNLLKLTNPPLGHETKYTAYDIHGRWLSSEDPNGLVTTREFDTRGRLVALQVGTERTEYDYDNTGQLIKTQFPDESFLAHRYDRAHRLVETADQLGNRIAKRRDAMGNVIREQTLRPDGTLVKVQHFEYDALNRLAKTIGGDPAEVTTYTYDAHGNLQTVTDALGRVTTYEYDALDRLVTVVDPAGGTIRYAYDANDNLTKVVDPRGLETLYTYDGLGNRLTVESPDAGLTRYEYDCAGNLTKRTDARGKEVSYTYDALDRPTRLTYDNGAGQITYEYDAVTSGGGGIGQLTRMTDPTGTTSWFYDRHGRITSKTHDRAGVALATGYVYDTSGRLTRMTYPSGEAVRYVYAAGELRALERGSGEPLLGEIAYEPFGPASAWTWGNGRTYRRSFDLDGRPSAYPLGSRTRTLAYDDAGRITDYIDSNAARSQHFDYDPAGRDWLTGFRIGTLAPVAYEYDDNGNRLSWARGADNDAYSYPSDSSRLLEVAGRRKISYTYDDAGNLFSRGNTTFEYDGRGRLTRVVNPALTFTYGIDGLGTRAFKDVAGALTRFVYDGTRLLGDYCGDASAIGETVWLGDKPVAMLQAGAVYYIDTDHLDAPRAIRNGAGTVVWRWDSPPFGDSAPAESGLTYNLRFPGQYFDGETGLYYNMARHYDPGIGRYIESDPVRFAADVGLYVYSANSPLTFVDPAGLKEKKKRQCDLLLARMKSVLDLMSDLTELRNRRSDIVFWSSVSYTTGDSLLIATTGAGSAGGGGALSKASTNLALK